MYVRGDGKQIQLFLLRNFIMTFAQEREKKKLLWVKYIIVFMQDVGMSESWSDYQNLKSSNLGAVILKGRSRESTPKSKFKDVSDFVRNGWHFPNFLLQENIPN